MMTCGVCKVSECMHNTLLFFISKFNVHYYNNFIALHALNLTCT